MKAAIRPARTSPALLVAAALAWGAAPTAAAQQRIVKTPKEGVPRVAVVPFRSTEKGLGSRVADELRKRLSDDFSTNDLWVISEENVRTMLGQSGFPQDEAPDRVTARLLAQQLRADEYIEGSVTRSGRGFHIDANMVLTRDNSMVQPLPPAEGKLGDAVAAISRSLRDARKQLADERKCEQAIQAGQSEQAIAAARATIAAYPRSTIGRNCLAQALVNAKAPADSVLAVTRQALDIDPRDRPALALAAQAYTDANRDAEAVDAWTRLLALDPTNVRLQTQVVNVLAASGNASAALPIIDTAVAQNPGDPELTRLQFLVRLAVANRTGKGWKGVIESGEGLLKTDTAATDSTFFLRLATAYAADSQPQKAAQTTARAVAKYPNSATLWAADAIRLKAAGQTQQSIEAARRALTLDPKNVTGWLSLADAQVEVGQPDSAVTTLRQAIAQADSTNRAAIAQRLLIIGNTAYKAGAASKNRADFQHAATILAFADTVASAPNVRTLVGQAPSQIKFLLGVSAFQIAASAAQENQRAKSCDLARLAQTNLVTAQVNIPAGGSFAPDAAKQLLSQIPAFQPAIDAQVKRDCR